MIVSTLAAGGPGSLREALETEGPRIIVFAVSGVIEDDLEILYGNVTVAGQTAPGAGITIAGRLLGFPNGVDNVIIRHIRIRPTYDARIPGNEFDAIQFARGTKLILDHVSAAFGVDETIDVYEAQEVTIQWSTIESSATSGHPEGPHNYALINGPDGGSISVHHNLFAHHKNRAPAIATGPAEVINNVAYDVRHGFIHHNPARGQFHIIGNTYRRGPSDRLIPFYFDDEDEFKDKTPRYYLHDNFVDNPEAGIEKRVDNPWRELQDELLAPESLRVERFQPLAGPCYVPVTADPARQAYEAVLARAGAFPRDQVTLQAVEDTRRRTGSWGAKIPRDLSEGLSAKRAPADRDQDGMADEWEQAHDLNPADPSDSKQIMPSGYTAVEDYVNGLADALVGAAK